MGYSNLKQAEDDWWDDWHRQNLAWDNLEGISNWQEENLPPNVAKNYQEYLRYDRDTKHIRSDEEMIAAGELVQAPNDDFSEGRWWHLLHVPLVWPDGSPAKSTWGQPERLALESVIQKLVAGADAKDQPGSVHAKGTDWDDPYLFSFDGYAKFFGAIFLEPLVNRSDRNRDLAVRCVHCNFHKGLGGAPLSEDVIFEACIFNGPTFKIRCRGNVNFRESIFSEMVYINDLNFFGVDFTLCHFFQYFSLSKCTFAGDFVATASVFYEVGEISTSTFEKHVDLSEVEFKKFSGIGRNTFKQDVTATRMKFRGVANFTSSTFERGLALTESSFDMAARFVRTEVKGLLALSRSAFESGGHFNNSILTGGVECREALFSKHTKFTGAVFSKDRICGNIQFDNTIFSQSVDFRNVTFPVDSHFMSGAFRGTRFNNGVDFDGSGVHWIAALDETTVNAGLMLETIQEKRSDREFNKLMVPACQHGADADLQTWVSEASQNHLEDPLKPLPSKRQKRSYVKERLATRLKQLEGGCRTVKLAMGQARNEVLEQRYYRYQLRARSLQSGVPFWEKAVSFFYGLLSDYGASIWNPLLSLVGMIASYAGGYWFVGVLLGAIKPDDYYSLSQAIDLSWTNVFKPLSALSNESILPGSLADFLIKNNPNNWVAFWIKVASTVESILAIVLVFLLALAAKRRFQIG